MSTTDISSGITNNVGVECVMTVHVYEVHDIFGKKNPTNYKATYGMIIFLEKYIQKTNWKDEYKM